jgi:ATP phosphoribosyltransferase
MAATSKGCRRERAPCHPERSEGSRRDEETLRFAQDDSTAGSAVVITLALSKGRILDETLPLLAHAGIVPAEDPETSRRLILATSQRDLRIVLVRANDVPTYVQRGGADLGVVGLDTLLEHGGEGLYRPLDLGVGRCRMSVAAPGEFG